MIKLEYSSNFDEAARKCRQIGKHGIRQQRKSSVFFRQANRRIAEFAKRYGASIAPARTSGPETQPDFKTGMSGPFHKPGHLKKISSWSSKSSVYAAVAGPRQTTIAPGKKKISGSKGSYISGWYSHFPEYGVAPPAGPGGDYTPYRYADKTRDAAMLYGEGEIHEAYRKALSYQLDHLAKRRM